ncbi:MAG: hypothetical protein VR64_19165 [Desulfatitalea sp. BRH_c12]|nr:MAG: hypothetical protein VR64_19165 [Desulfatitalea sp. BRH_c12]
MPGGDRTGPMGMGAMTGRAAGYCVGSGVSGYSTQFPGQLFGMGFGGGRGARSNILRRGGRGRRNMFYATGVPGWQRFSWQTTPYSPDRQSVSMQDKQALKNQAEALQSELEAIKRRLEDIESRNATD